MDTTIQISKELLNKLQNMKMHNKESYEDIIWDLLEDRMELSEKTRSNIKKSEEDIRKGRTITLEEIKKKRGI